MGWGSKGKIYVSSKYTYDMLTSKYPEYFPSLSVLFQIAAAIGIYLGEQKNLEKKEELINTYSIDKDDTFALLLEVMYPNLPPEKKLEELEKYAEAGIEFIQKQIEVLGSFNIKKFIQENNKQ